MTSINNILVYRINSVWASLASELELLAQKYFEWESNQRVAKTGAIVTTKIFAVGTSEAEIYQWTNENREVLSGANKVYCDGTTGRAIVKANARKSYELTELEEYMKKAAENLYKGYSPAEVYRQVFAALISTLGFKRVQLVLDNITDYNPLVISGIADKPCRDIAVLTRYAEEFVKLLPTRTNFEFVRVSEATPPDEDSLMIVHHHALFRCRQDAEDFLSNPRALMPYPAGLLPKAAKLCDLGHVVKGDILEMMREVMKTG